jgi:hypothetical protein
VISQPSTLNPQPFMVSIPVELPSSERMEEIYREECRAIIAQRETWLTLNEAAAYLRISRDTFDRRRKQWGLPVSDLGGGILIVQRADLDAVAGAHLAVSGGGRSVIDFPSTALKVESRKAKVENEDGRFAQGRAAA